MKELIHLTHQLSTKEKDLITSLYACKANAGKTIKKQQLLDLILHNKHCTDSKASEALYGKKPHPAFSQLKKRVKEDILNVLTLMQMEKSEPSTASEAEAFCLKLYLQSKIMGQKKLEEEQLRILLRANQLADKFELYHIGILLKEQLQNHPNTQHQSKTTTQLGKSMSHNVTVLRNILDVKEYQEDYLNLQHPEDERLCRAENLEAISGILQKGLKESKSGKITFLYHLSEMKRHYLTKDFEQALHFGEKLENSILQNTALNSPTNKAIVYTELAKIYLNLSAYPLALDYALKASGVGEKALPYKPYVSELLFLSYFQCERLSEAEGVIREVERKQMTLDNDYLSFKWAFWKANLFFKEGKFNQSLKMLTAHYRLFRDKKEFSVGYKLLELLNIAEKGEYDWFDYKLESFRKMIAHHKPFANKRITYIYQLLNSLRKSSLDFKQALQAEKRSISLLQNSRQELYRNPLGPEQINIADWIRQKGMV